MALVLEIIAAVGALASAVGALGMLIKARQVIGAQSRFASSVSAHNNGKKLKILVSRIKAGNVTEAEIDDLIRDLEKQLKPLGGSGKESIEDSLSQPSPTARKEFASKIFAQASAHKSGE